MEEDIKADKEKVMSYMAKKKKEQGEDPGYENLKKDKGNRVALSLVKAFGGK